jgi:RNA polymerase sigma-70 factor (ECF subfamily)
LQESVDMALLVVLEALTPAQRVAHVLHEVFGVPYPEIAQVLGRSAAATRQLATAARRHLHTPRARPTDPAEHARLVAAFRHACEHGDLEAMIRVLDPQATSISDGGGMTGVARRPISGAEEVSRFLLGSMAKRRHAVTVQDAEVNGRPGLSIVSHTLGTASPAVIGVVTFDTAPGRIRHVWITMNPDKLTTWNTINPHPRNL